MQLLHFIIIVIIIISYRIAIHIFPHRVHIRLYKQKIGLKDSRVATQFELFFFFFFSFVKGKLIILTFVKFHEIRSIIIYDKLFKGREIGGNRG